MLAFLLLFFDIALHYFWELVGVEVIISIISSSMNCINYLLKTKRTVLQICVYLQVLKREVIWQFCGYRLALWGQYILP